MATIKLKDLWRLGPGIELLMGDEIYLYVGRDMENVEELIDKDGLQKNMYEIDDDTPVTVDLVPKIDKLIQYKTRICLQLVEEGWTKGGDALNISNCLEELRLYKEIEDIVDDNDC